MEATGTRDGRLAFAYYTVAPVDPEAIDNRYLHTLLLDYGAVPEPERGLAGMLRDYVVRVERGSDDLLLGHALAAVGRHRIPVGWFVLERLGLITEPTSPQAAVVELDSGSATDNELA